MAERANKCINLMRPSAHIDWGGTAHRLCTERSTRWPMTTTLVRPRRHGRAHGRGTANGNYRY